MIYFSVPITPVPKGRPRFGKGFTYTDPKTRRYERDLALAVAPYKPAKPLQGPLEVAVCFTIPRPKSVKRRYPSCRPDIDNFCKSAIDALRAFWVDDGQIVELRAAKQYGEKGMVIIRITEINED